MSAAFTRALGSLRSRPGGTLAAALGLFLAGAMLGTAVTTATWLSDGFDRARQASNAPDLVATFRPTERSDIVNRVRALTNVESVSYRLSVRPVEMGVRNPLTQRDRIGTAQAEGIEPGHGADGLAIVAGRGLSGRSGEVVIERGLAREWKLKLGQEIGFWTRERYNATNQFILARLVGVAVEPDNVAFPLASRPRIYLPYRDMLTRVVTTPGRQPISEIRIRVRDRSRLGETLVQARQASFGLTGLGFTTRASARAIVSQASGLVVALLVAFAIVALASVSAMLAAVSHARVSRELPTIGTLRTIGFSPRQLALSYGLEAAATAVPAVGLGIAIGAFLVAGPTRVLLYDLNELPPGTTLALPHLLVGVAACGIAALAAALPALLAARRPVVESLRGARVVTPRRSGIASRPAVLGIRLALSRPLRLAVAAIAVGLSLALILLMVGLARFLLAAERDPSVIGERYAILADASESSLPTIRSLPGVAAAAVRYELPAIDVYNLSEPLSLVAFGEGQDQVFRGRPLLSGRRAAAPDEVEVGRGMAQDLGLGVGSTLIAQPNGGRELHLRVTGIVQELARDGRIGYTSTDALTKASPQLRPKTAVRLSAGTDRKTVTRELARLGIRSSTNGGLAPAGAPFLAAVVALLRSVAVVDAFVCAALIALALAALARERASTLGLLRALGGGRLEVSQFFAGAAFVQVLLALSLGLALEEFVLAPTLSGLVERYGTLPLGLTLSDLLLAALGCVVVIVAAAGLTAWRQGRTSVVEALNSG